MFLRILQHADAPRWNYVVGDRVEAGDLPSLEAYRERTAGGTEGRTPSGGMIEWVLAMASRVPLFARALPEGADLEAEWHRVAACRREDLVTEPEAFLPDDADLERLIVYDTSGTTGHAMVVPHHPRAMALNQSLLEEALRRHGVSVPMGPERVACINLGCQESQTVLFANVFAIWGEAGFAKVNLKGREWRAVDSARRFFADLAPGFLTGDPLGFAQALRWEIPPGAEALVSTATALSEADRSRLVTAYGCPVIDWYSTTETGPIACSCPEGEGLHLLAPDLFVEAVDEAGHPVPPGEAGEITVTGGRNPYVPLLRYRTGDRGRIETVPCSCGSAAPRILGLDGRRVSLFRLADNTVVNVVDLGWIFRAFPIVQHACRQRADGSFDMAVRPAPSSLVDLKCLEARLRELLGDTPLDLRIDRTLGGDGRRVVAYSKE